jgi:hypothetical protein
VKTGKKSYIRFFSSPSQKNFLKSTLTKNIKFINKICL